MTLQYTVLREKQAHACAASWINALLSLVHVQGITFRSQGVISEYVSLSLRKHHFAFRIMKKHVKLAQRFLEHMFWDPNCLNLLLIIIKKYTRPGQTE